MRYLLPMALSLVLISFKASAQISEEDLLKQITPSAQEGIPPVLDQPKGDMEVPFRIVMEGTATLNYVFAESPDTFIVEYKMRLETMARNKVDIIKSKGQLSAGIKGFLAKWPTGECNLVVNVGEFPYEMIFTQAEEEQVRLDIKIVEPILENWESNCKFTDAPGSKFNTRGPTEHWFDQVLKRTIPPLRDVTLPIDRLHKNATTLDWRVERFLLPDPPLGSIELEGQGTLKVIPVES